MKTVIFILITSIFFVGFNQGISHSELDGGGRAYVWMNGESKPFLIEKSCAEFAMSPPFIDSCHDIAIAPYNDPPYSEWTWTNVDSVKFELNGEEYEFWVYYDGSWHMLIEGLEETFSTNANEWSYGTLPN